MTRRKAGFAFGNAIHLATAVASPDTEKAVTCDAGLQKSQSTRPLPRGTGLKTENGMIYERAARRTATCQVYATG